MSDQPEEDVAEVYGSYYPEAAQYGAYNEAMAAWRNQVRAMQSADDAASPTAYQDDFQSVPATDVLSGTPSPTEVSVPSEPLSEPETVEEPPAEPEAPVSSEEAPEASTEAPETSPEEDQRGSFDPSDYNAIEVMNYLEGVGEAEARRVLDVEANSDRPRKGIIGQRDTILKRARRNDHKKAQAASSSE